MSGPADDPIAEPALGTVDAEGLFRLAAESLPSGVLVVGPDGRIALVNKELERQFGYSRDELVGEPVDMLLPPHLRAGHAGQREAFMRVPETRAMGAGLDLFGRRRDGSMFPVEVGLNPIHTAHGTFVLAAVVDITVRRQVEQTTRVIEGQLEFERLVAELSVQFINVPADEVDDAIRAALGRIGEALELDRCTFFRISPDGLLSQPIGWQAAGVPPQPASVQGSERYPWALEILRAGEVVSVSRLDEVPSGVDRQSFEEAGTKSAVTVPLSVSGKIVGAVGFNRLREERQWQPEEIHRLKVIASAFGSVLARRESEESLRRVLSEVQRLRDQLDAENAYLRREVQERQGPGVVVGQSSAVRGVLEQIRQVAATDSTVLLLGETGTGKELFATQIHRAERAAWTGDGARELLGDPRRR